jgi:hypothetical protein
MMADVHCVTVGAMYSIGCAIRTAVILRTPFNGSTITSALPRRDCISLVKVSMTGWLRPVGQHLLDEAPLRPLDARPRWSVGVLFVCLFVLFVLFVLFCLFVWSNYGLSSKVASAARMGAT